MKSLTKYIIKTEIVIKVNNIGKYCMACNTFKTYSNYYKAKYNKDGYMTKCKSCYSLIYFNKYNHSIRGIITAIYSAQKTTSKKRGHSKPTYSKIELTEWITSNPNFYKLYNKWVNSNYNKMLKPSIDRLDNSKGYSFDNIRLTDWKTNHNKDASSNAKGNRVRIGKSYRFNIINN